MKTNVSFDATLGTEAEAVTVLKAHILATEKRNEAEKTLELLKPQVEAIRTKYGVVRPTRKNPDPPANVILEGSFRDKKGEYIVTHVVTGQTHVRLEVLQRWAWPPGTWPARG